MSFRLSDRYKCKNVNVKETIPISDHIPVKVEYEFLNTSTRKTTIVRNWKNYTKEKWLNQIQGLDWTMTHDSAQEMSNHIENKILEALHVIAPMEDRMQKNNSYILPPHLIKMRKKRKNLFKNAQRRKSARDMEKCKQMDKEIRRMDFLNQRNKIRQKLRKGDSATLWEAVNIAKGSPPGGVPEVVITETGEKASGVDRSQAFADYFEKKVKNIANSTLIPNNPDLGEKLVNTSITPFFSYGAVLHTMKTLKGKKCFGYDNVPLLVLRDGAEVLAAPFADMFREIYESKTIPDQWKISRTIPLFKKGNKKNINSYRPISNLCSSSKIFERIMLGRLMDIEDENNVDLTGEKQHGFKKGRSTITALKEIQSQISQQMDDGNYVAMGSLDLSAAFDVVNIKLLMERLVTMGLPMDWLELLDIWLSDRAAFVEVSSDRSMLYNVDIGTVQGSILGPVLFSLFVSPGLRQNKVISYADDSYAIISDKVKDFAIKNLGETLSRLSLWFKDSGLKVNEQKTEITIFHKNNSRLEDVIVNGAVIRTKETIKVLGLTMDTTLSWHEHVNNAANKIQSKIHAIRMIQRFFKNDEILLLLKVFCYTSLYYASSVWLTPSLHASLKSKLFSASGKILSIIKIASYKKLHKEFTRATPEMWQNYELAVSLYDLTATKQPISDWHILQKNVLQNRRSSKALFTSSNKLRCGINILPNRMKTISNRIERSWFQLTRVAFKLKCKNEFITTPLLNL